MNIGDVYENRKNPTRHIRIVSCVDGKVKADVLGDGGNVIDEMELSESSLSKHWKLFEAAPVVEGDPIPAVTLDDSEAPGEGEGDLGDEQIISITARVDPPMREMAVPELAGEKPQQLHVSYDDLSDEDLFEDVTLEFKGSEGRIVCKCGQAYLISKGCGGRHFDKKKAELIAMHADCLRKKEVQKKLAFGHETREQVAA